MTGLIPLAAGWAACHWINSRVVVVPPVPSPAESATASERATASEGTGGTFSLPSLTRSLLPIVLPLLLIWLATGATMLGSACPRGVRNLAELLGNRNIALLIGAGLSAWLLMRQRALELAQVAKRMGPALEAAGGIILIIGAGGAFGAMLRDAGIGSSIKLLAAGWNINLVLLAYVVAVVIRWRRGRSRWR